MKIDPKYSFIFGVFTSILLLVGGTSFGLTNMVPDMWIPTVKAWAMNLGAINSVILTAMNGYSSTGPGPLAPPPTVSEAHEVMNIARNAAI